MSSNLPDEIANYFSHFRSEHEKLPHLQHRLHCKLLVVAMLSSLAEGRYPDVSRDKTKFVKLIETYAKWSNATSVSVSQLEMQIKKHENVVASGLSVDFVDNISVHHARSHGPHNQGRILGLDIDPTPESLLSESSTKYEKELVEGTKHSSLLYRYRCKLVHEFREPGHGFEFDQRCESPFYHSAPNFYDQSETIELVYPKQWLLDLIPPILTGLETYYIDAGINPYDSYNFGSPWC